METKRCMGCGRTLPLDDFSVALDRRDGHKERCRKCEWAWRKHKVAVKAGLLLPDRKQCRTCGQWFVPAHGNERYCSGGCRKQADHVRYIERKRAEMRIRKGAKA